MEDTHIIQTLEQEIRELKLNQESLQRNQELILSHLKLNELPKPTTPLSTLNPTPAPTVAVSTSTTVTETIGIVDINIPPPPQKKTKKNHLKEI